MGREIRPDGLPTFASNSQEAIALMRRAKDTFYHYAQRAGFHQYLEFAGLMNAAIETFAETTAAGEDGFFATKEAPMPFGRFAYVREKLDCIYGPALLVKPGPATEGDAGPAYRLRARRRVRRHLRHRRKNGPS